MRSYRYVVLVVLVVAVCGGWVSLGQRNAARDAEYQAHLADARAAAEIGVTRDVVAGYEAALAIRPSVAVSLEMADYLRDNADAAVYEDALEKVVARHPHQSEAYERLVAIHVADDDLDEAFDVLDKARDREVTTDELTAQYDAIAYRFEISGSSYSTVQPFGSADVAAVEVDGAWRFVDAEGRSFDGLYEDVGPFWNGQGSVVLEGMPQYVDKKGKTTRVATRLDYQSYGILAEGLLPARARDGSYTYLTESFRPPSFAGTYLAASSFVGGRAAVQTGDGWSVIDTDGNAVGSGYSAVAVDEAGVVVGQDRYFAQADGAFHLFDLDGAQVVGTGFEDARPFGADGFAAVQIGGAWGFVDAAGELVIEPAFEDAQSFAHGVAAVKQSGLWGYVDTTGTIVIDPTFADASRFSSKGTALVATPASESNPVLAPAPGTMTESVPDDGPQGDIVWRLLELVRYQR